MDALVFSLAGDPRGKGRPRTSVRGGFARVYTDAATRKYEASIKHIAALEMRGRAPFEGPLSVSLRFRLSPPKSMSKRQRAAVLAGDEAYLGRVDLDNCAKAVLDAMNGVAFLDDVQIVRLFLTKVAAAQAGADVRIEPLQPQEAGL